MIIPWFFMQTQLSTKDPIQMPDEPVMRARAKRGFKWID